MCLKFADSPEKHEKLKFFAGAHPCIAAVACGSQREAPSVCSRGPAAERAGSSERCATDSPTSRLLRPW